MKEKLKKIWFYICHFPMMMFMFIVFGLASWANERDRKKRKQKEEADKEA